MRVFYTNREGETMELQQVRRLGPPWPEASGFVTGVRPDGKIVSVHRHRLTFVPASDAKNSAADPSKEVGHA